MRPSLRDAALRPANLAILGAALVAGLGIALWLLPLGLIAFVAAVSLTFFDPQATTRPAVPTPIAPQGTAFQPQLDSIERARAEIVRSVAAAEGPLRPALERITAPVDEIVQEAYTLVDKGQLIVDYLRQTSLHELNVQLARVEEQIAGTNDPELRRQYEETRAAFADRLKNAQALGAYRDRITAQLENIAANLDNVLAETVRLRSASAAGGTLTTDSVASRLSDVRADMDALGKMLDTAITGVT